MEDLLVVGAGIAGLRAAIEGNKNGKNVVVLTKAHPLSSFSINIQDGVNASIGNGDSWESHVEDTLRTGQLLNNPNIVSSICREAPQVIEDLDKIGLPLHRDSAGSFELKKLIGSNTARTATVDDITGHALMQVLYEQALKGGVEFLEEWYAVSLIIEEEQCKGVIGIELATGDIQMFAAKSVVLATGGIRRMYEPSTASLLCTSDGIAMAYRAGADLSDMEMVQYHPCVIKNGRIAISELILAQGAELVDSDGTPIPIITSENEPWENNLSRTIVQQLASQNNGESHVMLKTGLSAEQVASSFFMTNARLGMLLKADLSKDSIPVAPAMHRILGGIAIGDSGATSIPGLYAAGECSNSGFHGAGSLDGNVLLASIVSGGRAGRAAVEYATSSPVSHPSNATLEDQKQSLGSLHEIEPKNSIAKIRSQLSKIMSEKAGLIRNESGLTEATQSIQELKTQFNSTGISNKSLGYNFEILHRHEVGFLLDTAETIVASSLARRESRGVHYRSDYETRNDQEWSRNIFIQNSESGPEVTYKNTAS
jgi:succinate dehydrogenase / fumarate reductase flavoprotein subunit